MPNVEKEALIHTCIRANVCHRHHKCVNTVIKRLHVPTRILKINEVYFQSFIPSVSFLCYQPFVVRKSSRAIAFYRIHRLENKQMLLVNVDLVIIHIESDS